MTDLEFQLQHRAEVLAASPIDMQHWLNKAAAEWLNSIAYRTHVRYPDPDRVSQNEISV